MVDNFFDAYVDHRAPGKVTAFMNYTTGGIRTDLSTFADCRKTTTGLVGTDGVPYSGREIQTFCLLAAAHLFNLRCNDPPASAFPPGVDVTAYGKVTIGGTPA